MENKSKLFGIIIFICAITLFVSSCFSPYRGGDEGTFSIAVGSGSSGNRVAMSWLPSGVDSDDLTHTIHLSGPGSSQTVSVTGTQTVSFSVVPGKWEITVEGSLEDGEILSVGSATVNITPGDNGRIPITMRSSPYYYVSDSNEWNNAITAITNGGNNKEYMIFLTNDIVAAGYTSNTFGSASNINVTVLGSKTITLNSNGSLLRIGTGQTVTMKDVQLKGQGTIVKNNTALVYINGGKFVMETGSLISGNKSSTDSEGGGVHIQSGTFTMNGGTISGNTVENGGGVFLRNGTFNMNGGMISGNIGTFIAGGVLVSGGTFIMSAGTISGNEANNVDIDGGTGVSGGGFGGGVYVEGGTFALRSGTLSGNTAVTSGAALYIKSGGTATYGVPGTSFGTPPIGINTTITETGPQ
jgi:hypothetical protein